MSRGLGALQRRILATLDEAKATQLYYRGAEGGWDYNARTDKLIPIPVAWLALREMTVELPPGVYDLRCSAAYLAKHDDHYSQGGVSRAFAASFARATHGLVRQGLLARLYVVPVARVIQPRHSRTATCFRWASSQLRFVTLSANPIGLTLRGNRPGDRYSE